MDELIIACLERTCRLQLISLHKVWQQHSQQQLSWGRHVPSENRSHDELFLNVYSFSVIQDGWWWWMMASECHMVMFMIIIERVDIKLLLDRISYSWLMLGWKRRSRDTELWPPHIHRHSCQNIRLHHPPCPFTNYHESIHTDYW